MADKHTPGPWTNGYGGGITGPSTPSIANLDGTGGPFCGRVAYSIISVPFTGILKDSNEAIAVIPQVSSGDREANARLIASAPDLLAALESAPKPPDCPSGRGKAMLTHAEGGCFECGYAVWYHGDARAKALRRVRP